MTKHISFDVWGTLISANKNFALARSAKLAEFLDISSEHANVIYKTIKQRADRNAELFATASTTNELISSLLLEAGAPASDASISTLRDDLTTLFLKHPPLVLPCNRNLLRSLKAHGFTLSIGSNSNFISGETMYPWLQEEFDHAFSFGVFSDLEDVSKPGREFFEKVFSRSNKIQTTKLTDILHVGDNQVCDSVGPLRFGMQSRLITNPSELYPTLSPFLL